MLTDKVFFKIQFWHFFTHVKHKFLQIVWVSFQGLLVDRLNYPWKNELNKNKKWMAYYKSIGKVALSTLQDGLLP